MLVHFLRELFGIFLEGLILFYFLGIYFQQAFYLSWWICYEFVAIF